jgi:hypothetical protein
MGLFFDWCREERFGIMFKLLTLLVLGCALLLLFFQFSSYHIYAGAGAVLGLVAGSAAVMKSTRLAKAIAVASLIAIQLVTLGYLGGFSIGVLLLGGLFAILDIAAVWLLLKR